jgi:hypothetical protein
MKGKIFATLFALPFFGVGIWMAWSAGSTLHDASRMQQWNRVEARLITAGYETRSGDESDTYLAYASYTYTFRGGTYTGDRVTIASGADNIGDYQRDMGNALGAALARGETVTVYVDPDTPSESIIDPGIRWGLLGFKSIFVFVFGGVGLGLLIFTWRSPAEKDRSLPQYRDAPWLLNDAWQTPTIRSGSRTAMWGAWAFAAFWNAISSVTPFIAYREVVEKQNHIALIALLFPLVGMGLLYWALTRTLEWRRFGPAPVTLDPFPGSIGGHVGGIIDLALPYDSAAKFRVTLTNLHSYISGSGKNRSRREKAEWQDELVAHSEPGSKGTRLTFRFDVPERLSESDAVQDTDAYYLWRMNVSAKLPGADLNRDYDIPVYATAAKSRHLSERAVQQSRDEQDRLSDKNVLDIIRVKQGPMGRSLHYPMGRNLLSNLIGFAVGAAFAAAGWFLVFEEGAKLFGGIFGVTGGLIALSAFYMMTNSLEVTQDGTSIRSLRRWLGFPVKRRAMSKSSFRRFDKESSFRQQSGGKHTIFYSVYMFDHSDNKMLVGLGFKGESEANAAIRFIARTFGVQFDQQAPAANDSRYGEDVLTADF